MINLKEASEMLQIDSSQEWKSAVADECVGDGPLRRLSIVLGILPTNKNL